MYLTPEFFCLIRLKQVTNCALLYQFLLQEYENTQQPIKYTNFQLAQFFEMTERGIEKQIKSLRDAGMLERKGGVTKDRLLIPIFEKEWLKDSSIYDCLKELESKPSHTGKEIIAISEDVLEVFNYWNGMEIFPKVEFEPEGNNYLVSPKVMKLVTIVQSVLGGKFYNFSKEFRFHHDTPWQVRQIKWAMDNFKQAATDPDCYPIDKKSYLKRTLDQFFFNRFLKLQAPFIRYQEKPTVLNIPREPVRYQGLYLSCKSAFEKELLHGQTLSTVKDAKMVIISNFYGDLIQEWIKQGAADKSIPGSQWAGRLVDFVFDNNSWISDPIDYLSKKNSWSKVTFYLNKIRALIPTG